MSAGGTSKRDRAASWLRRERNGVGGMLTLWVGVRDSPRGLRQIVWMVSQQFRIVVVWRVSSSARSCWCWCISFRSRLDCSPCCSPVQ